MIYAGKGVQVAMHDQQIAKLTFDLSDESVNKFNAATLEELAAAISAIKADSNIKGLMLTSAKSAFIVGADITEFLSFFAYPEDELMAMNMQVNNTFNMLEDLPIPSVALINGMAFGGGFEVCLAADYRIMSAQGSVALPEVKLGIMPGWGGSVRLPRLIGVDNAIEWICSGSTKKATVAMADGAADAVVEADALLDAGVDLLQRCIAGELDFTKRKAQKNTKLGLTPIEQMMAFETAKGFVAGKAGPHYPAPVQAIKTIQKHANMSRDKALLVEAKSFAKLCKTPVATNLVGLFLADQYLKRTVKKHSKIAAEVNLSAVLGAGIMGGGIAYQSAYKGIPIVMKDIADQALQLGLDEAAKILDKLVSRGRLDSQKMAKILNQIRPTLNYADLANVDLVVEAVVESPKVKSQVLAEVEQQLPEHAVLTSNTSTISIDLLAQALQDPSRFCGMHFFNPVHRMPLVEIIRGAKPAIKPSPLR